MGLCSCAWDSKCRSRLKKECRSGNVVVSSVFLISLAFAQQGAEKEAEKETVLAAAVAKKEAEKEAVVVIAAVAGQIEEAEENAAVSLAAATENEAAFVNLEQQVLASRQASQVVPYHCSWFATYVSDCMHTASTKRRISGKEGRPLHENMEASLLCLDACGQNPQLLFGRCAPSDGERFVSTLGSHGEVLLIQFSFACHTSHSHSGALEVGRVFDIPLRSRSRKYRFDVMLVEGDEIVELAAATAEEKASWLRALCTAAPIAELRQHPRAAEFL
jgi:hypothetical protein